MELTPRQAAETLDDLGRLHRRARQSAGVPWFPLVCFGGLTLLSSPLVAVAGTAALLPLWLVAGGAGMLITRRHYVRRAHELGVTGRGRGVWRLVVVMFGGCLIAGIAVGQLSDKPAGVLVPIVVVFAGYLALGWMQRDPVASLAIAPGVALSVGVALGGAEPWIVELIFGATLVLAGAGLRSRRARP